MSILISQLLKQHNIGKNITINNEQPFSVFARATSFVEGKKCVFISNEKFINNIDDNVSMVITTKDIANILPKNVGYCVCENPRGLFFELLSLYESGDALKRISTVFGENCNISSTAVISPYNVKIGNNVVIGDYVVIQPNTIIGDNVTIQSGTKIAEQDFNVYNYEGVNKQVYHSGMVIIGSNVLISSNVLVGQALYSYGKTVIGDNCFIGANTCIGHNTEVESGCEICGNSMIGGFCKIGKNTKLFMTVSVANALNIGDDVTVSLGSVVVKDIPDGKTVFGNPAREYPTWISKR